MMPSQNIAVNAWRPNLMATRFLPNFDKGAEPPICRIIFSIIAIFHKGLVQISFSLSSPTLRHYQSFTDFIFATNTDGSGKAASYVRALDMPGPILTKHCGVMWKDDAEIYTCERTGVSTN